MGIKRTTNEIKELVENNGYLFIKEYMGTDGYRKVIIRDDKGYKYDVRLTNLERNHNPYRFSISNPFTLYNISLWLKLNDSNFYLNKDNCYLGSKEFLSLHCSVCNDDFKMRWNDAHKNTGCPICSGHQAGKNTNLAFVFIESNGVWDFDKNDKLPSDYTAYSGKSVWWKCENKIHISYERIISSAVRFSFRCPECVDERKESFLQEKVRIYLNTLNFTIRHENNCTIIPRSLMSKNKAIMPFDNEVEELKLIIEVHGKQHYIVNGFHYLQAKENGTSHQEELDQQKIRDNYKKEYDLSQGYYYLEISYLEDDEKETWKQSIDNSINEILKNHKEDSTNGRQKRLWRPILKGNKGIKRRSQIRKEIPIQETR